jgi:energy-coupling factor transporter ATP-binding protein EcfA2
VPETPAIDGGAVVELRGVGRVFPGPPDVTVLQGVDLILGRGDYLSIIGPSGSGKSTLLHLLGLFDRPSSGSYHLEGSRHRKPLGPRADRAPRRSHRVRVPVLPSPWPSQCPRERRTRPRLRRRGAERAGRACALCPPPGRLGPPGRRIPNHAVRWGAPASRDRTSVGHPPFIAAGRRADGQPRLGQLDRRARDVRRVLRRGNDARGHHPRRGSQLPCRSTSTHCGRTIGGPCARLGRGRGASSARGAGFGPRELIEEALAGVTTKPARLVLMAMGTVLGVAALVATVGLS